MINRRGSVERDSKQAMHNNRKAILFSAGAIAGVFSLLGVQSLASYDSIAMLLADQSASAVARNYGLLAAGLIGLFVGSVRLTMASERQSQDKRSDLFDRFQRSSEMLDSQNMAVRQAGLYTLAEIAKEQPADFYIMVQSLFCGFLRHASDQQKKLHGDWESTLKLYIARTPDWPSIRADMEDAIALFSQLRSVVPGSKGIEKRAEYKPGLKGLFIPGFTSFENLDFSNSNLEQSVFCDAVFATANFDGSNLEHVNMDRTCLFGCHIRGCHFEKLTFRWSAFAHTICTGFTADRVDLTGTMATKSDFYISDIFKQRTLESLVASEKLQPQFESFEEQKIARNAAIEMEKKSEDK